MNREIHGTGIIVNTGDQCYKMSDSVTPRAQHLVRKGVNYVNVYFPTNDQSDKGKQKLVESLSDLDVILKPLAGEPIVVVGDFNLSSEHKKWRKDQFQSFLKKHELTLHTPLTPTNFPRAENHKPAALDHLACTKHFKNVKKAVRANYM